MAKTETVSELLTLDGVGRRFSGFELAGVSFSLEPGYIMGLVGPNGSGKTTTIKLIMNMIRRGAGKIRVLGLDNVKSESEVKRLIGYVSDENIFVEEWKAADVKKALGYYYPGFDGAKFDGLLRRFELPGSKRIKELSRGMKTRLMLAAALSRPTRLLLLDEPTSGLDPAVRSQLLDLLQDYIADGAHSVLFSTHITADLEKVADFITFLYRGRVIFTKTKDETISDYLIVKGAPGDLNDGLRGAMIGLRENRMGFEGLIPAAAKPRLAPSVIVQVPSLDDIVVYHTKEETI